MTDFRNFTRRAAATTLLAAGLALAAAPLAQAAGSEPLAPSGADLAAAHAAAGAPATLGQLGHFFARKGVPPTQPLAITPAQEAAAAGQAAPRLTGATVPVYTLAAEFVAGRSGAPVAQADFTATEAVAADGQTASVWTVRDGAGWRVVNIASGADETAYAAKAASGGGGTAFREPQVNAWYVLRGGRVLPLDDEARRSVGAGGVTLAAYQKLVHQRYGDKLPGSAYDKAGKGGGFQVDAAPSHGSEQLPLLTGAAALGAVALTGAGLLARRRANR
ncbi:hypothetical protein CFP65_4708 [Kitasatospora sp. MMS16-BH015]|uniref:hypothetical protein n=1 Tax=Kitasatospora sp. MMS16-BH015 TaxID=2018025 RepID=UPI000CA24319|nr:hypothetical protein [Kitasatospora sp. MMS16-BH015]AUG79434.1 hypothetical protein CFP65_4708 [Kitasatospora sp. MMS16-BH015]